MARLYALMQPDGTLLFARTVKLLEVQPLKLGLGIKGIDMGRPAFHVKEDAMLGLGLGKMRNLGRQRPLGLLSLQHGMKSQCAQPSIDSV